MIQKVPNGRKFYKEVIDNGENSTRVVGLSRVMHGPFPFEELSKKHIVNYFFVHIICFIEDFVYLCTCISAKNARHIARFQPNRYLEKNLSKSIPKESRYDGVGFSIRY